jgi:hypothetical protein
MRVFILVAALGALTVSSAASLASPGLQGGYNARFVRHAPFGSTNVYTPPRNENFEGSPSYEGPSYWRFGYAYRQGYR